MSDKNNSLLNVHFKEQEKTPKQTAPWQRRATPTMNVLFTPNDPRQKKEQQARRDQNAAPNLDRLNHVVEKENEAHDFFGTALSNWKKTVTGRQPSKESAALKKQFDDYENIMLTQVPQGGRRHTALSASLPGIKNGFLKQGYQFAQDKREEHSRSVLDKGLKRIAQGAPKALQGAGNGNGGQAHEDRALALINQYVLSEAKFDEKDGKAMYDRYLNYAGAKNTALQSAQSATDPTATTGAGGAEGSAQALKTNEPLLLAENDTGVKNDAGGKGEEDASSKTKNTGATTTVDWHTLGKMSQKYESGTGGAGTVSSGKGDPGGASYGIYQMTSKSGDQIGGTVGKFVQWRKFPHKERFVGKVPGTPEFSKEWKQMAKEDPKGFAQLQHEFIYESHFQPAERNLNKKLGIKLDSQSRTLNEVIWSASVQYSPTLMSKAIRRFQTTSQDVNKTSPEYEERLIKAIYQQKTETECPKCSDAVKASVSKRINNELHEALIQLREEKGKH